MARLRRKDLKHDEFVEGFVDFGHWLEENWRTVVRWAGVVVGVGIVVGIGFAYVGYNRGKAAELIDSGMASLQRANGSQFEDPVVLGAALDSFERAAKKGGGSARGKLARFYQAVALYRLGRLDESIAVLEGLLAGADAASTMTWSAQGLLAELYVDTGQAQRAIELLEGLAGTPEGYPADQALLRLGQLYQSQGNPEEARKRWERVVAEHGQTLSAQEARSLLASL